MNQILESLNQKNSFVKRKPNIVTGIIVNENLLDDNTYYCFKAVICTTKSNDIIATKLYTAKKQGRVNNQLFDFEFGQLKNKKWIGLHNCTTYQKMQDSQYVLVNDSQSSIDPELGKKTIFQKQLTEANN